MNFLAHLLLAGEGGPSRVGAILPDLSRTRGKLDLHPVVAAAVVQHRRIDAFTDTHPIVARSKARLLARHGRFSGILVDVFYDHVLAANFDRHHAQPLPPFVKSVYADLRASESLMPEAMRLPVARMIEQDWLGSYATVDGIAARLAQMSFRFSARFDRAIDLVPAAEDLRSGLDDFTADFAAFFPELCAMEGRV